MIELDTNGHAASDRQRLVFIETGAGPEDFRKDRPDVTDEVDVTPLPSIGGREITFEVAIPKGTTILVTGVRKCWNCPFDRIDYAVKIPELTELTPHRVFARSEALALEEVRCVR